MIPDTSLAILGLTAFFCSLSPIILLILWTRKTKRSMKPFFVGAAVFIIFTLILEGSLHAVILQGRLSDHVIFYVLYSCLITALIEEGGRYIAFRFVLKNETKEDAITYGIGHGGIEMMLLVGISLLSLFMFGITFNSVGMENMLTGSNEIQKQAIYEMVQALQNYGFAESLLCIIERSSVLLLHLSCSVLVLKGVRTDKMYYLSAAFVFHVFINLPSALMQKQVISNVWFAEGMVLVVALVSVYFAYKYVGKYVNSRE